MNSVTDFILLQGAMRVQLGVGAICALVLIGVLAVVVISRMRGR